MEEGHRSAVLRIGVDSWVRQPVTLQFQSGRTAGGAQTLAGGESPRAASRSLGYALGALAMFS